MTREPAVMSGVVQLLVDTIERVRKLATDSMVEDVNGRLVDADPIMPSRILEELNRGWLEGGVSE